MEAIDTSRPQPDQIIWYQDIIRALHHLQGLRIAHSDIRKDNIFFDSHGRGVLGDFSASCPFGHPNPSRPTLFHGVSETVSDATDRLAMDSLIYELEFGVRPEIMVNDGELLLPSIHTGHEGLGSLMGNARHGQYNSTHEMLQHAIDLCDGENVHRPIENPVAKDGLLDRFTQWRKNRENECGCVLCAFPTENELQSLAERYNLDMHEELRFPHNDSVCSDCTSSG